MNKNKVKFYYILLASIIGVKVVATIFSGGLSVHHGKKISQLTLQKNNLLQQELSLTTQLSSKSSLAGLINEEDLTEYQIILNPTAISMNSSVASR